MNEVKLGLSIREAADLLGLHFQTVRQLAIDGRIGSVRVGKRWIIPRTEIDKFLTPAGKG